METREELEATLAAGWDRDTLAVYADHLQAEGDPRGELIVLDLQLEERSTPELVARRASLLSAWLGRLVPSDVHTGWIGDSFRLGFVEDFVIDGRDPDAEARLTQMLESPLAPYVRRITIRGDGGHLASTFARLSERIHPWLTELSVRSSSGAWGFDEDVLAAFVAATPRLDLLDARGTGALAAFPHPTVKRLRVTGWDALRPMFATPESELPTLTGVHTLDFAFYETRDPDERWVPQQPIENPEAALLLPALRSLDLSRNEVEAIPRYYDEEDYEAEPTVGLSALGFLTKLALRGQLTHVKLPSLRDEGEFRRLAGAASSMHALEEIRIDRGHYYRAPDLPSCSARFVRPPPWPWPRLDRIPDGDGLHVLCPGSRSGDTVPIADAVAVMERRFEDLPADVRYAWTRFWVFVDELGKSAWKTDATHTWTEDREFPADVLVAALEACEVGGSGGWRELRDELRFRRPLPANAVVTIHRTR